MNVLTMKSRRAHSSRNGLLLSAYYVFLSVGVLVLAYAGFEFGASRTYEAIEMKKFEEALPRLQPPIPLEGDVIGELQVPRLKMSAIVVQGDSRAILRRAVGHLSGTALPGEAGNVALAGHRDTFFRPLGDIRLGDEIRFRTLERTFEYRVDSIKVVVPTETKVLDSSTGHDLTLLTCFPFYYIGPAPKRFVVHASEAEKPM